MSSNKQQKLVRLSVFLAPVLLVKGAAFMMDTGPVQAEASSDGEQSSAVAAIEAASATIAWTESQRAAARHLAELATTPFGPVPIYADVVAVEDAGDYGPEPVAQLADLRLQAILTSTRGSTALIDGKPYTEGVAIAESGWTLIEIRERSVVVQRQVDGATEILEVDDNDG